MILKPGGYISSVIDYGAHEFSTVWYDHLYYSENLWKFLMHGRNYPINRFSQSYHLSVLSNIGFEIVNDSRNKAEYADHSELAKSIQGQYNKEDLSTKSGYILARKPI